ncbi:MAG: alpha/beta fold hydrolase [Anaerolineaceae bacterium]|jgi:pimeloyl-ACP methyl ester carboxylesterase
MTALLGVLLVLFLFFTTCIGLSFVVTHKQSQSVHSSPAEFGLRYKDIPLLTSDGIQLRGWWIPAEGSTCTIIFLHGYAGSCDPDLKYVPFFHEKGFNVVMFDFRAHGRSDGAFTSMGYLEKQDCLAAVDFALSKGSHSIGMLGFSMGGRVALLTAPEAPAVQAVISDGGPARITTVIVAELTRKGVPHALAAVLAFMTELGMSIRCGVNLFDQEPYAQCRHLAPLPVLFIHGDHDPNTRPAELERMVREAGENAICWRVPEAGHRDVDAFRPEEYVQKVTAFFERWLPEG